MKKVVIYTSQRCAHCNWAKELLNKKNIKFTEHNVVEDPTKRECREQAEDDEVFDSEVAP